jgi:pimeloyl-ACP methyl ester carboxylesterase
MAASQITERGIWFTQGGDGDALLVLLHGLGANSSVWKRVIAGVDRHWRGRWIAPDLRGHGRSIQRPPYGCAMHAADIADIIAEAVPSTITLFGHSFGGVVAALVATGWFGFKVRDVAAIGVKIEWTADEVDKARAFSHRPARGFATREAAAAAYLKFSGLSGLVDPASEAALAGVTGADNDYRVAFDMRAFAAAGPSVEHLLRLADPPIRLAAGARDPMVTLEQMRRIDANAMVFPGVGHNAHWEVPEEVWAFLAKVRMKS